MDYQERNKTHHMTLVYIILGLIFIITVTFAILTLRGYRWNLRESQIEAYGVIQIRATPSNAKIKIDDQELNFLSGTRLDLAEGKHRVVVSKDGYHPWSDEVLIKGSKVKWLNVRLTPEQLKTELVRNYPVLLNSYEAPNHRFILNHLEKNRFELLDLNDKTIKQLEIDLSKHFTEANKYNFEFIEWNLLSDSLLFQDKQSATKQTIMINYKEPKSTLDLTKQYADKQLKFTNFQLTGDKGMVLYTLEGTKLYRANLAATDLPAELIAEGVTKFRALNDNRLVFSQVDAKNLQYPTKILLLNYKQGLPALVDRVLDGVAYNFDAVRFNDNDYLVYGLDKQLLVFKASGEFYNLKSALEKTAKTDKTKSGLLYESFLTENPKISLIYNKFFDRTIDLRPTATPQFVTVLLQNQAVGSADPKKLDNPTMFVYDLENDENFQYTYYHKQAQADLKLTWLDNVILWNKTDLGLNLQYFSGKNNRVLNKIEPLFGVKLDADEAYLYYFTRNNEAKIDLMRLKMTN